MMPTIRQTMRSLSALAIFMSLPAFADNPDNTLLFTIEGPGIQETQVASTNEINVITQDFNAVPRQGKVFRKEYPQYNSFVWKGVGTYEGSGANIDRHNKYGAAGGKKRYLFIKKTSGSVSSNPGVTLTFDTPVAYFGFWWSAGDHNNKLKVTLADGTEVDVGTNLVLNSVGFINKKASRGGHLGSPTQKYRDQNSGEGYAYLNLYANDPNRKIAKIRFHGTNFETDNHSISTTIIPDPPGIDIPLPPIDPPIDPPVVIAPPLSFGKAGRFNFREVNHHIVKENGSGGGGVSM
jgi:hypothetical protein